MMAQPEYHTINLPGGGHVTIRQSITPTAQGAPDAGDWLSLDCETCQVNVGRFFISDADWLRCGRQCPPDVVARQRAAIDRHILAHARALDAARGRSN